MRRAKVCMLLEGRANQQCRALWSRAGRCLFAATGPIEPECPPAQSSRQHAPPTTNLCVLQCCCAGGGGGSNGGSGRVMQRQLPRRRMWQGDAPEHHHAGITVQLSAAYYILPCVLSSI